MINRKIFCKSGPGLQSRTFRRHEKLAPVRRLPVLGGGSQNVLLLDRVVLWRARGACRGSGGGGVERLLHAMPRRSVGVSCQGDRCGDRHMLLTTRRCASELAPRSVAGLGGGRRPAPSGRP